MTYMYIHAHSVDSLIIFTKTLFANVVIVVYSLHFFFLSTFLSLPFLLPSIIILFPIGILMIISWILLAASGAFFSTWVKPVFPNPRWFNAHRILMAQSLIVGVLGFCFAFIAHAKGTIINGLVDFDHDVGSTRLQLCDTIGPFTLPHYLMRINAHHQVQLKQCALIVFTLYSCVSIL